MINIASLRSGIEIISNHGFAEIRNNVISRQKSLHALQIFEQDEMISYFSAGKTFTEPNYLTVQIEISKHITLVPEFLQYINHSCDPNIFFDTSLMKVIALKKIFMNDELTFFYPSTEWEMAQPFYCYCGNHKCLQNIQGAKYIAKHGLKNYKLTEFIKRQIK